VAAHGLANLALRTLALDPAFRVEDVKDAVVSTADFTRGRRRRRRGCHSPRLPAAFTKAAAGYRPQMLVLVDELPALQDDLAVTALFDLRSVQYHRWRGESPDVTGVNLHWPTKRQLLEQGQAVGLGAEMLPPYTEGQQALAQIVKASRDALDAVVARLPGFRDAWYASFG